MSIFDLIVQIVMLPVNLVLSVIGTILGFLGLA
jgi:hypothetical protein